MEGPGRQGERPSDADPAAPTERLPSPDEVAETSERGSARADEIVEEISRAQQQVREAD